MFTHISIQRVATCCFRGTDNAQGHGVCGLPTRATSARVSQRSTHALWSQRRGASALVRSSPLRQSSVQSARRSNFFCSAQSGEPSAAEYQEKYGIKGSVSIVECEKGGLTKVVLTHWNKSMAELYLFGAVVTSWCQPQGSDVLYVRPDVIFDGVKPISGGVPHCFPRFGPSADMQQHGFARNCTWKVVDSHADINPDYPEPAVLLQLQDNDYTRSMWNYSFKAVYEVTLRSDRLKVELRVLNTGGKEFDFTTALHSYFGVADASSPAVNVKGLKGKSYLDKVPDANQPVEKVETHDVISFGKGLVDSVYLDTEAETLLDVGTGCSVSVENTRGFSDTVVWNPHETLKPEGVWKEFVCVESAQVSKPVVLGPGDEWLGEVNISVFDH